MYEVKQNTRALSVGPFTNGKHKDVEMVTYTRDVVSHNILTVEAGTTEPRGGETNKGGVTYFSVKDSGSTNWDIDITHDDKTGYPNGFEVTMAGSAELETIIRALKFITKVLEEESKEVCD